MIESFALVTKETATSIGETIADVGKREVAELPKKIGRLSEVESLPDKVDLVLEEDAQNETCDDKGTIYMIDGRLQSNTISKLNNMDLGDNVFEPAESVKIFLSENTNVKNNIFTDLNKMKSELGKTYGEIKENKPPNSPNIAKWFEKGGSIKIDKIDGKQSWTYIDNVGRKVSYIDGYPIFPPEAKHPLIDDIDIGRFTGDRNEDKKLYLDKLEKDYGLTEIPDGYMLHHDSKNGNMQLIKSDWHKEFTHAGGHSLFMGE